MGEHHVPEAGTGAAPGAVIRPFSIAPMMDRTDRHYRFFARQLTRHALLYSEMVTTAAILHGDREHLLGFHPEERPLALQLGGDSPEDLATCAGIGADMGYDEINLNVGCPSDRVQAGRFGVCLMEHPRKVAAAVAAMRDRVEIPVTVKHRIGFDDLDHYDDMLRFVDTVADAGCQGFIVHARKAWLTGLSPKENRTVPPLRYDDVHRLKRERPDLRIEVNGGITSMAQVGEHLAHVDGVMIGRAAYDNPYLLAGVDVACFGDDAAPPTRAEAARRMVPYIENMRDRGVRLNAITRHMFGLFAGRPGARAWRRTLTVEAIRPGAGAEVLRAALETVQR